MAEEEKPKREVWVYAGQRLDGDKLAYVWYVLDDEGFVIATSGKYYNKSITRNCNGPSPKPGAVFVVNTSKKGASVHISGGLEPKYERMLEDRAKTAEWQVMTEAARDEQRAIKLMKEDMADDKLEATLRPIVRAMQQTNALGRHAIKLVVMRYLSRHG